MRARSNTLSQKNRQHEPEGMAKPRHVPIRSCIICRQRMPKHALRRYVCPAPGDVRNAHGLNALVPDLDQVLPGRGFYVCNNPLCCEKSTHFQGWKRKCKGVPTV